MKAVLRGRFISENTFIKIEERSEIINLNFYLKELNKEQTKPKSSRKKEIKRLEQR